MGVDLDPAFAPVPMFSSLDLSPMDALRPQWDAFKPTARNEVRQRLAPTFNSVSYVLTAEVRSGDLSRLREQPKIKVWDNSELTLYAEGGEFPSPAVGGTDCRPFRPGAMIETIRELLSVDAVWSDGFRGQNIVVGIIDEGVNGGGFSRPDAGLRPGQASITSHGSMCAADVLIAAPQARIYDYPFLGVPRSGGALQMFQAVLSQRHRDGTPHVTRSQAEATLTDTVELS